MKNIIVVCFVMIFVFVGQIKSDTWPASGSWTYLEPPTEFGAVNAYALGIDGQNIVGYYNDGTEENDKGFFYNGTTWTTINPIDAICTYVVAASGNNCAGYYLDSSYNNHGFFYNGAYTFFDAIEGNNTTYVSGISGNKIVGGYEDAGNGQGFIYDRISETYTFLTKSGAVSLSPNNIDGSNVIGEYYDGTASHNFFYNGTSWNSNPDALLIGDVTRLFDIDGSNILGDYADSSGLLHNFLYDGVDSYDLPNVNIAGATKTSFSGISGDNIAGWYINASGYSHIFVYNTVTVSEPSALVILTTALVVGALFFLRKKLI